MDPNCTLTTNIGLWTISDHFSQPKLTPEFARIAVNDLDWSPKVLGSPLSTRNGPGTNLECSFSIRIGLRMSSDCRSPSGLIPQFARIAVNEPNWPLKVHGSPLSTPNAPGTDPDCFFSTWSGLRTYSDRPPIARVAVNDLGWPVKVLESPLSTPPGTYSDCTFTNRIGLRSISNQGSWPRLTCECARIAVTEAVTYWFQVYSKTITAIRALSGKTQVDNGDPRPIQVEKV